MYNSMEEIKAEHRNRIASLVVICFIGVSALWMLSAVWSYKGIRTLTWKETTGTIIKSKLITVDTDQIRVKKAAIAYEYNVKDNKFISTKLYIGTRKQKNQEYLVKKYPEGKHVKVYYNYKDPSTSVLKRGIPPIIFKYLLLSIPLTAIGLMLAYQYKLYSYILIGFAGSIVIILAISIGNLYTLIDMIAK